MHPNGQAVADALTRAGAAGQVRQLTDSARTAADAAAALGCEVGAIENSLVFRADDEPLLILTGGAHRVDPDHVARLLGVRALRRASPEQVRASPASRSAASHRSGMRNRWARSSTPRSRGSLSSGQPAAHRTRSSPRRTTSSCASARLGRSAWSRTRGTRRTSTRASRWRHDEALPPGRGALRARPFRWRGRVRANPEQLLSC